MFFSIAVSRVAPVLFPNAMDEVASPVLAQGAVAILEKVKTVDRERGSRPHALFFQFHLLMRTLFFSTQYDRVASDFACETARLEKQWRPGRTFAYATHARDGEPRH